MKRTELINRISKIDCVSSVKKDGIIHDYTLQRNDEGVVTTRVEDPEIVIKFNGIPLNIGEEDFDIQFNHVPDFKTGKYAIELNIKEYFNDVQLVPLEWLQEAVNRGEDILKKFKLKPCELIKYSKENFYQELCQHVKEQLKTIDKKNLVILLSWKNGFSDLDNSIEQFYDLKTVKTEIYMESFNAKGYNVPIIEDIKIGNNGEIPEGYFKFFVIKN